jgi:hypothetical protein
MTATRIARVETIDVRFLTSDTLGGSDAMNPDPDYSAAYVILHTDTPDLAGHGFTFTIGRGNDVVVRAVEVLAEKLEGLPVGDLSRARRRARPQAAPHRAQERPHLRSNQPQPRLGDYRHPDRTACASSNT